MIITYLIIYSVVDEDVLSKEVKSLGFPIQHRHKLCCLRQELIDSFIE
jgi:protein TIF31